eukprot:scaffold27504_cov148-Amphora_coffeaeformis.AAC.6
MVVLDLMGKKKMKQGMSPPHERNDKRFDQILEIVSSHHCATRSRVCHPLSFFVSLSDDDVGTSNLTPWREFDWFLCFPTFAGGMGTFAEDYNFERIILELKSDANTKRARPLVVSCFALANGRFASCSSTEEENSTDQPTNETTTNPQQQPY